MQVGHNFCDTCDMQTAAWTAFQKRLIVHTQLSEVDYENGHLGHFLKRFVYEQSPSSLQPGMAGVEWRDAKLRQFRIREALGARLK